MQDTVEVIQRSKIVGDSSTGEDQLQLPQSVLCPRNVSYCLSRRR